MLGQFVPILLMNVLTLTLIEAAGAAEYRKLPGIDQRQQMSAKIMQRSNLIIMPNVSISFILGTLSTYEKNVALYGTFTLSNGRQQMSAKIMQRSNLIIMPNVS